MHREVHTALPRRGVGPVGALLFNRYELELTLTLEPEYALCILRVSNLTRSERAHPQSPVGW